MAIEGLIDQVGNDIYITLSEFKGNCYIDLRKYYEAGEGELKPTRKGITFNPVDWKEFVSKINEIDAKVQELLK